MSSKDNEDSPKPQNDLRKKNVVARKNSSKRSSTASMLVEKLENAREETQNKLRDEISRKLKSVPKSIAIVSGKGGSGKTMLAVTLAKIFEKENIPATLVDADVGTGGMSYYLSLKYISGVGVGLCELATNKKSYAKTSDFAGFIQNIDGMKNVDFISIGDHRKLFRDKKEEEYQDSIGEILSDIQKFVNKTIIVDCRGGMDPQSIEICKNVDDILIVVETDGASYQTTQHLVDILSDNELLLKVRGFFINKVLDDPSSIIRNGAVSFRSNFLSAIPLDLDTIKKFLVGETPLLNSLFGRHVWAGACRCYPDFIQKPPTGEYGFKDYEKLSLADSESQNGGVFLAICLLFVIFYVVSKSTYLSEFVFPNASSVERLTEYEDFYVMQLGLFVGLLACIGSLRRFIGRFIKFYISIFTRIIGKSF